MLTIKHVENDQEQLIAVETVLFVKGNPNPRHTDEPTRDEVRLSGGTGDGRIFESGKIYVMNAAGQTVGNYDLGDKPKRSENTQKLADASSASLKDKERAFGRHVSGTEALNRLEDLEDKSK